MIRYKYMMMNEYGVSKSYPPYVHERTQYTYGDYLMNIVTLSESAIRADSLVISGHDPDTIEARLIKLERI